MKHSILGLFLSALMLLSCRAEDPVAMNAEIPMSELPSDNEGWKKRLTPEQYRILREAGTERAWTGAYNKHYEDGTYRCAGCGAVLFTSAHKFDSGCGWPAFSDLAAKGVVKERRDTSHGMVRVEVVCARCEGHLGHVFEDGPTSTGLRYCINSVSMAFEAKGDDTETSVKNAKP